MGRPWGLSGPDFLWLYGAGLVVALGVAIYLRWWVRRPPLVEPLPAGDASMVAYLMGGKRQLVETALARLIEQGAVRVSRDGKVTTTATSAPDPLDHAVLIRMGGRRARRVHEVLDRAEVLRPIADLAESFATQPLRVLPDRARRASRLGLLIPYLLLVVGVARFVNGLVGGYPVVYLALELIATLILIAVLHEWGRKYRGQPTVHAQRIVAEARTSRGAAMLVALGGVDAYPDKEIASALGSTRFSPNTPPLRRSRATRAAAAGLAGTVGVWGTGSSCGGVAGGDAGGGSSCGGSSCGGGGCGGGGGGCGGGSS